MKYSDLRRTIKNLQKKEYFQRLLKADNVFIHLRTDVKQLIELPPAVEKCYTLVLCIGTNTPYPIPDLAVTEEAISATLTAAGKPHKCRIPWESIYYMGHEGEIGFGWPEDVPITFLHHWHMKLDSFFGPSVYDDGLPAVKKENPFKIISGEAEQSQPQENTSESSPFLRLLSPPEKNNC